MRIPDLIAQSASVARDVADHTPAWLAFVGALIVASLAAGTAQWRLRRQLKHDRELNDVGELRHLLDECARMAGEANQLLLFMLNRATPLPRSEYAADVPSKGRPLLLHELGVAVEVTDRDYAAEDPEFRALEDAFYATSRPVFGLYQRIVLRLGQSDEVSKAFLALQGEWVASGLNALLAETDPNSEERAIGISQVRRELGTAHFAFLTAAQAKVGSRAPAARDGDETTT